MVQVDALLIANHLFSKCFPSELTGKEQDAAARDRKGKDGAFFVGQQVPQELVTTPFHQFCSALSKCRTIDCPLNSL